MESTNSQSIVPQQNSAIRQIIHNLYMFGAQRLKPGHPCGRTVAHHFSEMQSVDFSKIAPRCGSQHNSFEELCCQLARRMAASNSTFKRFRGAGGDGGVECLEQTQDGQLIGWQAKFVFDTAKLIAQADRSLTTALEIHPGLTEFVLCFPYDPTGPTGRKTKKGIRSTCDLDKIDMWMTRRSKLAAAAGRSLAITLRPRDSLIALLIDQDPKGGMREYFFNSSILSREWFRNHLERAAKSSQPRYSPSLNVDTPLYQWIDALGHGPSWKNPLKEKLAALATNLRQLAEALRGEASSTLQEVAAIFQIQFSQCLPAISRCIEEPDEKHRLELITKIDLAHANVTPQIAPLPSEPQADVKIKEAIRNLTVLMRNLRYWLETPPGKIGFMRSVVITGDGGSGKTHGMCDAALGRLSGEAFSCIVFGHRFGGQPSDWTRFSEELGLSNSGGMDALFDTLNSAGEASGNPLIICIDAINETEPRSYWRTRLKSFAENIVSRQWLRLCVSCRSSFLRTCLPEEHNLSIFEHRGFHGFERMACKAFFEHYGLVPPLQPLLQPELGNPLYLKLLCETLRAKGLKHLLPGLGIAAVMRAFLEEKEKCYSQDHECVSPASGIVRRSLQAIALGMHKSRSVLISFFEAENLINDRIPYISPNNILHWLVRADLLIEEGPTDLGRGEIEPRFRIAFERLSDFLIALEITSTTSSINANQAIMDSQSVLSLFADADSVRNNSSLVGMLSILFAERWRVELPYLVKDSSIRADVLVATMRALSWRSPRDFNDQTTQMVNEEFDRGDHYMKDRILRIATQPSSLDALWIHSKLSGMSISERDPMWCDYLLQSHEMDGITVSLIEAADNSDLELIDHEVISRWALLLCWFTAAADRRIKDSATRSLTRVFRAHPSNIVKTLRKIQDCDDDEIVERALLAAYGALLTNKCRTTTIDLATLLYRLYEDGPDKFQHAQIRDLIRCIFEMAEHFGCPVSGIDTHLPSRRKKGIWHPVPTSKSEMDKWLDWDCHNGALFKTAYSCTNDDFNHYSIGCLMPWMKKMNKVQIGQWLIKHIVDQFDIGSKKFDCYDNNVSYYGHGRSKPAWAERIGKKYQWISLNRLASRLHDKYPREIDAWRPKPVRLPLILQEERKMDPSIPVPVLPERKDCWWLPTQMNLEATRALSLREWTSLREDIPLMESLLSPIRNCDQSWLLLHTLLSWSEYDTRTDFDTPYRSSWIHLRSYLVPDSHFGKIVKAVSTRNYFQGWLPEGGNWLHCFLGEYPWATPFNTEPDSYMNATTELRDTNLKMIHTANTINCEWQYDGTLPNSIQYMVPAKQFFKGTDLQWNSCDGFMDGSGRTIFRDPHGSEGGRAALLVDAEKLPALLKKLKCRLVWTLLGGKDILGERRSEHTNSEVFSQFAYLTPEGKAEVLPRRFYSDHLEDIGPAPEFLQPRLRPKLEFSVNSIRFNC